MLKRPSAWGSAVLAVFAAFQSSAAFAQAVQTSATEGGSRHGAVKRQPLVHDTAKPVAALMASSSTRSMALSALTGEPKRLIQDGQEGKLRPLPENEFRSEVAAADTSLEGLGTGLTPDDVGLSREVVGLPDGATRGASYQCVHWAPSLVQHYPLYFEDAMLERHGQQRWGCLQPVASGSKFFSEIILLPYMATLQRPLDCKYSLGHYRPGTCAPVLRDQLPWDARAAAAQGAAATGFFWGMPL